jgi:hypothetical protein
VATVIAGVATGVSALPVPAAAQRPAAALYHEALAGARTRSVHYTSTSASGSGDPLVLSGDAGPASGTQTVSMGTDTLSIRVIGGITYLNGNAGGLEHLAGFPAAEAAATTGQWIDFATSNTAFAQVVGGVRSADLAAELDLSGPLTTGRSTTVDGTAVETVRGHQTLNRHRVAVVLYVEASGSHAPVEEDSENAAGHPSNQVHITFSRWGEVVRPRAPVAAVTLGPVAST